jgi:hypothetical protein
MYFNIKAPTIKYVTVCKGVSRFDQRPRPTSCYSDVQ